MAQSFVPVLCTRSFPNSETGLFVASLIVAKTQKLDSVVLDQLTSQKGVVAYTQTPEAWCRMCLHAESQVAMLLVRLMASKSARHRCDLAEIRRLTLTIVKVLITEAVAMTSPSVG